MSRHIKQDTINLNQLSELAKHNPRYAKMFAGLAQIDNTIKTFVRDIVENSTDASNYYIKTELMSQCYALYLYNAERHATVGVSWPLADFLKMCEQKTIENEMNLKVKRILLEFDRATLDSSKINWIY